MYRLLLKPLLFLLPAETAHHVAFALLRFAFALPFVERLARRVFGPRDPALAVQALGLSFPSPVLLAAGFDKDALGIDALGALGFGAVEIGTVTFEPQPGNARPRLFRLPGDHALINRMGFNNQGAKAVARRLSKRQLSGKSRTLVGVNIGKSRRVSEADAIADYVRSAEVLAPFADYFVVNVSSPNTPGLRDLQATDKLRPLLEAVRDALGRVRPEGAPALLVKIAPDLADENIDEIADLALSLGLAGIIATNTTIRRDGLLTPESEVLALGAGGLSGAPLKARSLAVLTRLAERVGTRLTLVAAGGIETPEDAWERLRAGATLIQVYTAFVYEGPLLPSRLARGLADRARTRPSSVAARQP